MTDETTTPRPSPRTTLAQRLNHLFATVHPKGRGPYTNAEAAEGINTLAGAKLISHTYLWQLRKGERNDPSLSRTKAIADFFGVSVLYFSDDETAARTDAQLQLAVALRDKGVQRLALRSAGLPDKSLEALAVMADSARQLAGLPEIPPGIGEPDPPSDTG